MTRSAGPIARFLASLVLAYALLAALWYAIRQPYAAAIRSVGASIVAPLMLGAGKSDWAISVAPVSGAANPKIDTQVTVQSRRAAQVGARATFGSWHLGYVPAAVLVALTLATPIGLRRLLRSLAFGLLAVHAFVLLRLVLVVLVLLPESLLPRLLAESPGAEIAVFVASAAGRDSASYFAAVVIWIATTLRREDLERVVRGA